MDKRRTRGRTRNVSRIALARKASEERSVRVQPPHNDVSTPSPHQSGSSSPLLASASVSPANTSTSPLDDPEMNSLEDQLHMAYCLDNMDLCRAIFLKIKGIEITGDDDPRLAAVKPEDFDECFMPNGPLMTEEEECARLEQMQDQERQRIEQMQEALEAEVEQSKQTIWEVATANRWQSGQKKFKVAKIKSWKLKEEESRAQDAESSERRRQPKLSHMPPPPRLSYDTLAPLQQDPVVSYSLKHTAAMQIPKRMKSRLNQQHQSTSRTPTYSGISTSLHTTYPSSSRDTSSPSTSSSQPPFSVSDTVPFNHVVRSMQGQLFPLDSSDRQHKRTHSGSLSSSTHSERKAEELLDLLLQPVEFQEGDRFQKSVKGKQREVPLQRVVPRSSGNLCAACLASSSMPAPPIRSSTSSTVSSVASASSMSSSTSPSRGSSFFRSRRASWLSFGSSSSYVTSSTAVTTPSSSPSIGSWFKSSSVLPPVLSTVSESSLLTSSYRCTCQRPFSRLTAIPASDGPLSLELVREGLVKNARPAAASSGVEPQRVGGMVRSDSWSAHMSHLVALAKGFQAAYVGAVVFGAVPTLSSEWDNGLSQRTAKAGDERMQLEKPGFRARSYDVALFLGDEISKEEIEGSLKPIPLLSPFPPVPPQSTVLPSLLPYDLKFKQGIPPPPSPMKRFAQMAIAQQQGRGDFEGASSAKRSASPARNLRRRTSSLSSNSPEKKPGPVARARFIPNPVYLRIRALQNTIGAQGLVWEGYTRDGTFGCGKERLVGIAFEDLPRSSLCVEEHIRVFQQKIKKEKVRYGRDMGVFNVRAR